LIKDIFFAIPIFALAVVSAQREDQFRYSGGVFALYNIGAFGAAAVSVKLSIKKLNFKFIFFSSLVL
jgi:hypothetical protein